MAKWVSPGKEQQVGQNAEPITVSSLHRLCSCPCPSLAWAFCFLVWTFGKGRTWNQEDKSLLTQSRTPVEDNILLPKNKVLWWVSKNNVSLKDYLPVIIDLYLPEEYMLSIFSEDMGFAKIVNHTESQFWSLANHVCTSDLVLISSSQLFILLSSSCVKRGMRKI